MKPLKAFCLSLLAVFVVYQIAAYAAELREIYNVTTKYRNSTIYLDANSTIADESARWTLSNTELGYLDAVTSNVQTQINNITTSGSLTSPTITNATFKGGVITNTTKIYDPSVYDGTLTNSALKGGTMTGTAVSDGSITNAAILGGTMTGTAIVDGTLTNTVFGELGASLPVWSTAESKVITKTIANTKILLGIDSGTAVMAADGTVTQAFAFTFASTPIVVSTPIGTALTTNSIKSVTTTNVVFDLGDSAGSNNWIAVGAP